MRFELRQSVSHRTDAKADPRTQLTGSPIGRWKAWTVLRAAASRRSPVQYQRQRSQSQQDIQSSWRWFLHRSHELTGQSLNGSSALFDPSPGTPACVETRSIPRGKFLNASARRSNCFALPSEWRHDLKAGNESSGQDFRSTRPSLAVNYLAHVADSQRFLLQGPLFSKTSARADSQKRRSPVPLRIASRARKRKSSGRGGRQRWRFLIRTRLRYAQWH